MNFLSASFKIGRFAGIDVRVHILFVIWAVFQLADAGSGWRTEAWFMGLLFGIVLVHEFGHCFGARSVGGDARNIMLWPLGGLAFAHAPMTPWAQFVTVACGPLVNVGFCLISALVLVLTTGQIDLFSLNPFSPLRYLPLSAPDWLEYVGLFYIVNYWLLALNLLPVYPLDGGQLLQCALWPFMGLQRAMETACKIGIGGCIVFAVIGLRYPGMSMLFFIAIFGGFTCWQRLQALKYGMVVDERVTYAPVRRWDKGGGFWSRLFRRKPKPWKPQTPTPNPNPGAWDARMEQERTNEAELDRILKKVHEQGIHSLSYIERQTLERASRERQARDREFERQTRL